MEKFEWECPKCSSPACPDECVDREKCKDTVGSCQGLLCNCDDETPADHGETYASICPEAHCYHCGWGGKIPQMPKKTAPWEKKALAAGWTPPPGWNPV